MRKLYSMPALLLLFALSASISVKAQTTVFNDNFDRATFTTRSSYGTPPVLYTLSATTGTINTTLISGTNYAANFSSGAFGGGSGRFFAPINSLPGFNSTLHANSGLVTWTFNMRTSAAVTTNTPASGALAGGVVLCSTGAGNILSGPATGYGVVFNSGASGGVALVKFSAGLSANTTLITQTATVGATDFYSVRVTYDPATNNWSLYMRDDGVTAFADPSVGVVSQQGAAVTDNTYTTTAMVNYGVLYTWNSLTSTRTMQFDNFSIAVSVPCSGTPAAGTVSATQTAGCTVYTPTLSLTGSSTSTGLSYQWMSSPDNITWTPVSGAIFLPFVAPAITGNVYYSCQVTCNSSGLSSSTPGILLTLNSTPPSITVSPGVSICAGSSTTLTAFGGSTYSWVPATGLNTTNGASVIANPGTTTTYIVTGAIPGCSNTATVTVTVNPLPTVGITVAPSASVCNGTNVTLSGTGASTYSWTGGITNAIPFTATTTTNYTVTGTDANGCSNTSTQNIIVNSLWAQTWNNVGLPGFSAGVVNSSTYVRNSTSIAMDGNGVPYVAYEDDGNGSKATVMKYNGSSWVTVGNAGFSTGVVDFCSIAIDPGGVPYVVYINGANSGYPTVMKYNNGSWVTVGNTGFSAGMVSNPKIAIDGSGTPYVVYLDIANGNRATVMKYNGSSWVTVGVAGFSHGEADWPSIKIDGSGIPYVFFSDFSIGNRAVVMKYNGSSWVTVGSYGFSTGVASNSLSMAIDEVGTPYVAFADGSLGGDATAMKYNGSSWVTVGSAGFSAGDVAYLSLAIDNSNTPYVAYFDIVALKATVMKFNGSSWVTVGNAGFSAGQAHYVSIAINSSGVPYVFYADGANGGFATVMEYGVTPITGLSTVCIGATTGLSDATSGGVWSSSNTAIAIVGSGTGIVMGIGSGTAIISYGNSCNSATAIITVNAPPAINAGSGVSICNGSSTTLSASGGTTYSWAPGTGLNTTIGTSVIANPTSTTTYTVTETTSTCNSTAPVTVIVLPTISAGSNIAICTGLSTAITATGGTSYSWAPSSGLNTTIGANVIADPTSTTTYTVTGTNSSCNAATITITVNPLPVVGSTVTPSTTVCNGTSVTLSGTGASTYSWTGGITNETPFTAVATNIYTVTGTDVNGCENAAMLLLTVLPLPIVGAISGNNSIYPENTSTLSDQTPGGIWTSSNTNIATVDNSGVVTGVAIGSVMATYSVTSGSCTGYATYSMNIISCGGAINFDYTGTVQTYTVPAGTTTLTVDLAGAQGGTYSQPGGDGGRVEANLAVTPGEVLYICVGGAGGNNGNGAAGGSAGGEQGGVGGTEGAGGGAGSDIRTSITGGATSTASLNTRLVVGGGGGGATNFCATSGGGSGGYPSGGTGVGCNSFTGGSGGTQTAGGAKGSAPGGVAGVFGSGGAGTGGAGGGGGGGGWYGGGGAARASGGGGSSYYGGAGVTPIFTMNGYQAGNGYVQILLPSIITISTQPAGITTCSGDTTTFNVAATGPALTYQWQVNTGDGFTNISGATNVSYSVATTSSMTGYQYQAIISGACGLQTTSSAATLTVNTLPTISTGPDVAICNGSSTILTATGGYTYSWAPSTGLTTTTATNVIANPASTLTYTVTGTSSGGCSNMATETVTVLPTISGGASTAICIGSSTTLNATGGNIYSWAPSTGLNTTTSASVIANPATTTIYTVTGTNSTCNTATVTVTVNPLPTVGVTASPSSTVCNGTSVTLSGTGANAYLWTGGVTNAVPFIPTITNNYSVTGTDTNGCQNTAIVPVNVISPPAVGPIVGTSSIYIGSTSFFSDPTTGGLWTSSNNSIATIDNTGVVTGVAAGNVVITYSVTSGSCTGYATFPMTVLNCGSTITFNYTGSIQTYTVPIGTTILTVDLAGAQGGSFGEPGGNGGRIQANLDVIPGQILYICVGGAGTSDGTGGSSPGGESGGVGGIAIGNGGGAGSDIRTSIMGGATSTTSLNTRLVVGGGGSGSSGSCGGANGGYPTGGTGVTCNTLTGGGGGTQTAPGAPGSGAGASGGGFGNGGAASGQNGGGGGGGWYGGGGARQSPGGGGSSYYGGAGVTLISTTSGYQAGNGYVQILVPNTITISTQPINITECAGGTASFNVAATGALNYQWQVSAGDGFTNISGATGASYSVATTSSMNGYQYQVIITGACGLQATSSVATLTVNALPITAGPDTAICIGSLITLTASGGDTYSWMPSERLSCSNCANPLFNAIATTTYTVTGSNAGGCNNTATVTVIVNPLPTIDAGSDVSICNGASTVLTATGSSLTYSWGPSVELATTTGATVTAIPFITTTYSVTGTDANGCTNRAYPVVIVEPTPSITTTSPLSICSDFTTSIPITATIPSTYTWTLGTIAGAVTGAAPCASGCDDIINQALTDLDNANAGSVTYVVTPTTITGSCVGTATSITQIINPTPVITTLFSSIPICSGSTTSIPLTATIPSTYIWTSSITGAVTGAAPCASGCDDIINQALTDLDNTNAGIVTYVVTPIAITGSCVGTTTSITQVINPAPDMSSLNTSATSPCLGNGSTVTITSFTLVNGMPYIVNYTLTGSGGNTGTFDVAMTYGSGSGTFVVDGTNLLNTGNTTVTINSITLAITSCTIITTTGNVASFNVNPAPAPITGNQALCLSGNTISLGETATGGTWTSSDGSVAIVNMTTGILMPSTNPGNATITYSDGDGIGCSASITVTVNTTPTRITGSPVLCVGGDPIILTETASGGTWVSSDPSIATVDMFTGVVTPVSIANGSAIYYSNGAGPGCIAEISVTVNPTPVPITGNQPLCMGGGSVALADAAGGGTWYSSDITVATIGIGTGILTPGVNPGNVVITYSNGAGPACSVATIATVGPLYNITASAGSNGSITPAGTTGQCSGNSTIYTITPNDNYYISDVLVDGSSVGSVSSYTFSSVSADHTISVTFAIDTFTVSASSDDNGNISPSGETTVSYGGSQTYTMTPNTGYHISDVQVNGSSVGAVSSYTFNSVSATDMINVTYAINTYSVTASSDANGSISPSGATIISYGGSLTYTMTPNTGYHISDVQVNGSSVGAVSSYTFNSISATDMINVNYAINTYSVTASSAINGSISPSGATPANYGSSLTYSITADAGYHVLDVDVDGSSVGAVSSYTFSFVSAIHTITATFAPDCITPTINCAGSITQSADAGVCNAVINYSMATVTGTSPAITYSQNSGTVFPVGVTLVTATAVNGCGSASCSFNVTVTPNALAVTVASTNVSCNGGSNGAITTSVTGGTGAYTYSWTGGASGANPTGLAAGTFSVTVTDNGCSAERAANAIATISQPAVLAVSATNTNATCYNSTGEVTTTVSGGTAPYSYLWSNGATTADLAALPGTYSVAITDANGCMAAYTTSITVAPRTVTVRLVNSIGDGIAGGTVQYYNGTWQSMGTTDANGYVCMNFPTPTFTTGFSTYFQVLYAGGTKQWSGISVASNPVLIAATTNVSLNLKDHTGTLIIAESGTAGFYSGTWTTLGSTGSNGYVTKELLPGSYYFNMNYHNYTQQQSVTIGTGPAQNVNFQTTLVTLNLKDHTGTLITSEDGTGGYYSGAWYTIGSTSGTGQISLELLPGTGYYFNMKYHNYTQQQPVTVGTGPTQIVNFQTTLVTLNLKDHTGTLITSEDGAGGYYSGAWYTMGSTSGTGQLSSEFLPGTGYYFNMKYHNYTQQQAVTVGTGPTQNVNFQTTLVALYLLDHTGTPIVSENGTGGYYSGAWYTIGSTSGTGQLSSEFLPGTGYYFNMKYHNYTQQQAVTVGTAPTQGVNFQTTLVTLSLVDHTGALITNEDGTGGYYSGAWYTIGSTSGTGQVSSEFLPGTGYYFNMNYHNGTQQQSVPVTTGGAFTQNVNFQTALVNIHFQGRSGIAHAGAAINYYSGGWYLLGTSDADGNASMEMLPVSYYYNATMGGYSTTQVGPFTDAAAGTPTHIIQSSIAARQGIQDTTETEAGLGNETTDIIKVYPNPNDGTFSIEVPAIHKDIEIIITDVTGRIIDSKVNTGNNGEAIQFNLQSVAKGIYLIKVNAGDTHSITKIVVR